MEEKKSVNPDCPCTNTCPNKTHCDVCEAHHKEMGKPTSCGK